MSVHVFGVEEPKRPTTVRGQYVDNTGAVWVEDIGGNKWLLDKETYIAKGYQPALETLPRK